MHCFNNSPEARKRANALFQQFPRPKNLAINLGGLKVHPPKTTFPYPPSGSKEKMHLVVRSKYKIQTFFLGYDFENVWIK